MKEVDLWTLPLSDYWSIHEERLVDRTLTPSETILLVDIKANGFLTNLALVANSPKIKISVKLAAPGGFDADYSITMEQLHSWGFDKPPGNHAPYLGKYDVTNHIYSIRISPPFPGPPFRGRATVSLKNEGVAPSLIIVSECTFLLIQNEGGKRCKSV